MHCYKLKPAKVSEQMTSLLKCIPTANEASIIAARYYVNP